MANARQRFWVWRWSLRAPKKRTTGLIGACLKGYRAMRSLSRLSGQIGTSREGGGLGAVVTWPKISDKPLLTAQLKGGPWGVGCNRL